MKIGIIGAHIVGMRLAREFADSREVLVINISGREPIAAASKAADL